MLFQIFRLSSCERVYRLGNRIIYICENWPLRANLEGIYVKYHNIELWYCSYFGTWQEPFILNLHDHNNSWYRNMNTAITSLKMSYFSWPRHASNQLQFVLKPFSFATFNAHMPKSSDLPCKLGTFCENARISC